VHVNFSSFHKARSFTHLLDVLDSLNGRPHTHFHKQQNGIPYLLVGPSAGIVSRGTDKQRNQLSEADRVVLG